MPEAINYGSGISRAWANVATFVPKLVAFLVILIIGYIVAKAIAKFLSKVLTKVGFDRLVERGSVKTALDRSQYDASDLLAKLVYYAIMLFVLSTAFGVFGTNPVSTYLHAVIAYLPLVFIAIIIVIIAAAIAAGAKALIQNSLGGLSYAKVLANTASAFILAIGVIAALDQLHIAPNVVNAVLYAALAAVVGVIIVAVGGGGIMTMSARWESVAARYDDEKPRIAEAVRNAPGVADQARQGQQQVRQYVGDRPYGSDAHGATTRPYDPQPGNRTDPAG
jgi:Conserved TM helix